jgi:mono/diheme cytochrome c family protein
MIPPLRRTALLLLPLALAVLPACQQKMAQQPSFRPDEENPFFRDGRANRPLLPGTVARGHLRTDLALFTGQRKREQQDWAVPAAAVGRGAGTPADAAALAAAIEGNNVEKFPFPITYDVMVHGRNRYMIYCVVCHDPLGTGHGKIVERGYTRPPSYHIERLRKERPGNFFRVITDGYGSMPDYRQQIPPRDRWAIIAYIRALQLSQHFPESDLTDEMRQALEKQEQQRRLENDIAVGGSSRE